MLDRAVSFIIAMPMGALCLMVSLQVMMLTQSSFPYDLPGDSYVLESFIMESNPELRLGELLEQWIVDIDNDEMMVIYEPNDARLIYVHDPESNLDPTSDLAVDEILIYEGSSYADSSIGDPIYLLGDRWTLKGRYSDDSLLRRWTTGPDYVLPLGFARQFQGRIYVSNATEQQLQKLRNTLDSNQVFAHAEFLDNTSGRVFLSPEVVSILPVLTIQSYCMIVSWLIVLNYQRKQIYIHYREGATRTSGLAFFAYKLLPFWLTGSVIGVLLLGGILDRYHIRVTLGLLTTAVLASITLQVLLYAILFLIHSSYFKKGGLKHGSF